MILQLSLVDGCTDISPTKEQSYISYLRFAKSDMIPPLNEKGINRIQGIVGALLYVGRAVNNKLLVALIEIGAQQAAVSSVADACWAPIALSSTRSILLTALTI